MLERAADARYYDMRSKPSMTTGMLKACWPLLQLTAQSTTLAHLRAQLTRAYLAAVGMCFACYPVAFAE
jgi:hypothetical protein